MMGRERSGGLGVIEEEGGGKERNKKQFEERGNIW